MGLFDKLFGKNNKKDGPTPHPTGSAGQAGTKSFADQAAARENTTKLADEVLLNLFAKYFAPNKDFYSRPGSPEFKAYFGAVNAAQLELVNNAALLKAGTGYTPNELVNMINNPRPGITSMLICGMIYAVGNYAVIKDAVYCVDFSEKIPNCVALCLLLQARLLPEDKRRQVIDAGDGTNKEPLQKALDSLKMLDPSWQPVIVHP